VIGPARIRIGRVRMKAGGADVRVIYRPQDTECRDRLRAWASEVLAAPEPPDAFFAIAYRYNPAVPASADATLAWWSDHPAFPLEMLPARACVSINRAITNTAAENQIMRALGYERDGDPDAAA
jgi:hypothetical protein